MPEQSRCDHRGKLWCATCGWRRGKEFSRLDDGAIEGAPRHFLEHPENRTDDLLEWRHIEVLIRQIDRLREARDGAILMAAL